MQTAVVLETTGVLTQHILGEADDQTYAVFALDLDRDGERDEEEDLARPSSCEKNPWAGRAESSESSELRLDVDGGSIARCLGSTAFM